LTTEYTPIQRGGPAQNSATPSIIPAEYDTAPFPQQTTPSQASKEPTTAIPDDGVDPTMLPPAVAPPSHPSIEPAATGIFDGRSILELDLSALAEKQWRRPGSDISDWFNYGFDELSWEAYCYRRRDLGELANVLKPNVIVSLLSNFIVFLTQFDNYFVCRTLLVCQRIN
jgi:pre-mRNA 3'-end-processing factor FIP1